MWFAGRVLSHPAELWDHIEGYIQSRWESLANTPVDYAIRPWAEAVTDLERASGHGIMSYMSDNSLLSLQDDIKETLLRIDKSAPFPLIFNADRGLAALVYSLCRAFRPRRVLSAGVGYGLLEAHILAALEANSEGLLYSIDVPPLRRRAPEMIGALIPPSLTGRWTLLRGSSRRMMDATLDRMGAVDLFVHDSLHTTRNILRELDRVQPYLRWPALVVVDDTNQTSAFKTWVDAHVPTYHAVLQQSDKDVMCGICFFQDPAHASGA